MTSKEKANKELKKSLMEAYMQWKNKYNINDEEVFYSDGEYDPYLFDVLENICIIEEE